MSSSKYYNVADLLTKYSKTILIGKELAKHGEWAEVISKDKLLSCRKPNRNIQLCG